MGISTDATSAGPSKKKPFYYGLFFQVIVAVVLGVLVGLVRPDIGAEMKPLGDAFINLIKMMIAPIIFCTIVTGIASVGDMKEAGRIGIKALFYFEVVTAVPLVMGLVAVHMFEPGSGMALNAAVNQDALAQVQQKTSQGMQSTTDFFMNIIPHTFVSAFTEGQILQVLLVALLFAFGVSHMGEKGKPIVQAIETISHPIFNIISMIVKLAPIGVFGAMAFSVSKFGLASLADLGGLMLLFFATCILFVVVVLGGIMHFYCKLSLWQFIKYIREELMISFGTASSEAVLPRMIDRMTHMGCARPVVGMVLPTGYSFNLDGTTLYLSLAAMFVAYACGIELSWGQQLTLLGVLMVTSKGAAAVYGAAFVVLAATLNSLHVFPPETMAIALALLFSIDRIMAPGRVLTNLIGNGVATLVIAKWENELDHATAKRVLAEA